MIEEWRPVASVKYLWASSFGRVQSEPYQKVMPKGGIREYILSPTYGTTRTTGKYSRKQITFRRKTYKVASLVAEAFLGPRPLGLDVSHKDENSLNNTPDNLLYESRKANLNRPAIKEYHRKVCRIKMSA